MSDRITDPLASFVESQGSEVAVTLVVQGTPIVGYLTALSRNTHYVARTFALWSQLGENTSGAETEPVTPAETARIRAEWAERHPFATGADDLTFDRICLRDAVIRVGPHDSWTPCPYLLVNSDTVSAIALGICRYDVSPSPHGV